MVTNTKLVTWIRNSRDFVVLVLLKHEKACFCHLRVTERLFFYSFSNQCHQTFYINRMFSNSFQKLKTNLRLAVNRLKLLQKKKTELAQKARKEIADYLVAKKYERAKIRVEYIIREDYLVEAMEIVEMYCDLLLARFGLIQQMK